MPGSARLLCWILSGVIVVCLPVYPQARPGRPALIRDTDTAEGKEEAEANKPKEYSPFEAERNFRIGNYYYKQKNYGAAYLRFKDALEYQPDNSAARRSLKRAYDAFIVACEKKGAQFEKKGDQVKAAEQYQEFLNICPDSAKAPEFKSKLAKVQQK